MKKQKVAGYVFLGIAVLHLIRFVAGWQAAIGSVSIPRWVSLVGVLVAGALAVWMLKE
jgi:hypothetical protein